MHYTFPPLPPFGYYETNPHGPDELYPPVAFTADQMQDYARASIEATCAERIAALEADKEVMAQVLRRLERTVDRLWVSHHANEADYALEQISAALALHEKARDAR